MSNTIRFGVSLDMELLDDFDALIQRLGYENRSEAIRDLIRRKLVEEQWKVPSGQTFGVVHLVYDHHVMSVDHRLTESQHDCFERIISTMHVHLDEHNCLEVIVLKGPGQEVRSIGQSLISKRGVKYGRLNVGTAGEQIH